MEAKVELVRLLDADLDGLDASEWHVSLKHEPRDALTRAYVVLPHDDRPACVEFIENGPSEMWPERQWWQNGMVGLCRSAAEMELSS